MHEMREWLQNSKFKEEASFKADFVWFSWVCDTMEKESVDIMVLWEPVQVAQFLAEKTGVV